MSNDYPPPGDGSEPPRDPAQPGQPSQPEQPGHPAGPPPPPPPAYGQPPTYEQPPAYGQPPAYPPPGAGAPGPGGYAAPRTSPLAIVSLVLGIVGFCCGQLFVLSIAAIVTGVLGRKQVKEGGGRFKGAGLALSGLILGIAGISIGIVYWILVGSGALDANFNISG